MTPHAMASRISSYVLAEYDKRVHIINGEGDRLIVCMYLSCFLKAIQCMISLEKGIPWLSKLSSLFPKIRLRYG